MTSRTGLSPDWPATPFEVAVEAVARGLDLSLGEDGRLRVRGPRREVDRLSDRLRDRREEIAALLASGPPEVERIADGPYKGFWMAKDRAGPDPVRGGLCKRDVRAARD